MPEYFDVVDKNDKVIGSALRSECHSNPKLVHRGIFIFVIDRKGRILLQKRSMKKDLYKGKWGMSVGGHNRVDESYERTAKREMKEELGINLRLKEIGKVLIKDKTEAEFNMVFEALIKDEKVKINKNEIDEVKFFTIEEIIKIGKEASPSLSKLVEFYLKSKQF